MSFPIILYTKPIPYSHWFSFQQLIVENIERIRVLAKHVKTDSSEPRSLFKHRTGVWPGSWGELSPPPSHFCFLGFPLAWEGELLRKNLLFFRQFPSAREDWLALKTTSIWPLQIAESMSTRFIHIPHQGIRTPKTHWWFPWFYGFRLPPRPATHFWFVCSQCPGICSVGNLHWEPIAPQLLPIKMCNWISHVCFKHHSKHDLQATV